MGIKIHRLLVIGIIVLHATIWIVTPYNTLHTVGLDPIEMIAWGRSLDLGYFKHPPMPSWVVIALESFLPTNIAVFTSSQLFIAMTAIGVWTLAKDFVSENSAVVAAIFTLIFPHTTWISPEWNHNLVQLPFWVWTIVAFHWVCTSHGNNIRAWAFMGAVSALGLYGKYSMGIVYVSIFLYAVLWRWYIFKFWGIWVFAIVFCTVLAPHAVWLHSVDYSPFLYAKHRLQEAPLWGRLGSFWGAFFVNLVFAGVGILIARQKCKFCALSVRPEHFLVYITWMPLVILTILAIVMDMSVYSTWNFPFLTVVPLMFIWWCEKCGYTMSVLRGGIWVVVISAGVAGYYAYYYTVNFNRGHYPAVQLATQVQQIWRQNMHTPLAYVTGNLWDAGIIAVYAPDTPKYIVDNDKTLNPSLDFNDVKQKGYMYVWSPQETPNITDFIATGKIVAHPFPPFEGNTQTLNWGIVRQ